MENAISHQYNWNKDIHMHGMWKSESKKEGGMVLGRVGKRENTQSLRKESVIEN